MTTTPSAAAAAGPLIRDDIPHSARVWNYWLGGKDYYEIDRIAGDAGIEIYPGIIDVARHSREVLLRVVRFVVRGVIVKSCGLGVVRRPRTLGCRAKVPG
ncbi:SAM-dependent methyltransferase [Nocardia puris]|nr:SAM-dependent methyltransferase [Nocardia puris]